MKQNNAESNIWLTDLIKISFFAATKQKKKKKSNSVHFIKSMTEEKGVVKAAIGNKWCPETGSQGLHFKNSPLPKKEKKKNLKRPRLPEHG